MSRRENYFRFEDLVRRLLVQMGYEIVQELHFDRQRATGPRPDFTASRLDQGTINAEVKWTRNADVPLSLLRDWAAQTARHTSEGSRAVLIASGIVEPSRKKWAEEEFRIEIWDRDFLLNHAQGAELSQELQAFFDEVSTLAESRSLPSTDITDVETTDQVPEDAPEFPKGQQLAHRLSEIATGQEASAEFERACEEIIDYLFGDSLTDARRQSRLDDGLSILDIVYRVKSQNPFWAALARDFRARVIVFECKNYEGPVGPMQVFTTERYMSAVALRSVCFVLSRTPAHPHAKVAAQGAMRETGKLIIFLDDEILKTMLSIRDAQVSSSLSEWNGNGPSEILDQEIYDFLATMPR